MRIVSGGTINRPCCSLIESPVLNYSYDTV